MSEAKKAEIDFKDGKKVFYHDVMYSGDYDVCVATLSVYPHRASLKNMPDRVAQLAEHWASIPKVVGSNPTVARYIFQACPVWIYTQSSNIHQESYRSSLI